MNYGVKVMSAGLITEVKQQWAMFIIIETPCIISPSQHILC